MMVIEHYGTPRRSGRYPWGSGGDFVKKSDALKAKGFSQKEIAEAFGMSTTEYRRQRALMVGEVREANRLHVIKEKERGLSVAAISRNTGLPESTIRDMLRPHDNAKFRLVRKMADLLKKIISKDRFVDVGDGVEIHMGITRTQLDQAVQALKNEGYKMHYLTEVQLGTGKETRLKVLSAPGVEWKEVNANKASIAIPDFFTNDKGENFIKPSPIKNMSSKRILVKYEDDGGAEKDGLIELRRGVPELNLGDKRYAQVRIGVEGTHFMKGMAVLRDDLPPGVDAIYYTSKKNTGNKLDAMKEQVDEGVSKFGAVVKPNTFTKNGKIEEGVVNIVGGKNPSAEGAWDDWNKTLASQVLSKQPVALAKKQLKIVSDNYEAELEEIKSLTNPTVRKHLLIEFADKADSAAVDLKAAALPRQTTSVLLPDPKLKPNEIYAPNYDNGEVVSLIRYPHGGIFEIPTVRVNNKTSEYAGIIGKDAIDAVAVHPEVASRLSGADFDGDFVLVVPNRNKQIRTEPALEGLKNFDPRKEYPYFEGMKVMSEESKQRQMGDVSNLITDMTIKGASNDEIARAVRHSMVVIDAAKHELNYRQSYRDNGIAALKEKYQGGSRKGASTLISRSTSEYRVPQRHDRYGIDPETGEKIYSYTNEYYIHKKTGRKIERTTKTTQGAELDPHKVLSSGTLIEKVYADHSRKMKDMANAARLETLKTGDQVYNKQSRITYKKEVDQLDAKLKAAIANRPVERKAQLLGNAIYKDIVESKPDMSRADMGEAKNRALTLARTRVGAKKPTIDITPREWEAIEMGAITKTKLGQILRNADMDVVRQHATPRATKSGLSTGKESRAKALLDSGYTSAEVAGALGVPVHQIRDLNKG